jgi:glucose/arabinose dehydrogenase
MVRKLVFFLAIMLLAAGLACNQSGSQVFSTGGDLVVATPVDGAEIEEEPDSRPTNTPDPTSADSDTGETSSDGESQSSPTLELPSIQISLQKIAGDLNRPVGMANAGDGSQRLFVLEKQGTIRIFDNGGLLPSPFLDITERVGSTASEQGLLGLAFHPDYANNGLFFVNYTNLNGDTTISRFQVTGDPSQADPDSEQILLTLAQPAGNHNGGNLVFGPDGYLYIGTGDGGAANDQFGNGQNGQTLLGAMLRIDVDGGDPYGVPADNPFVGDPAVLDEIWAIGLRNPWRYSFDLKTGDLYIADVGQNLYEEVNVQPADSAGGENYGWPIMEGFHCFSPAQNCDQSGLVMPVVEYDHGLGCSITGGFVYRGSAFPALDGIYFFGDYCTGRIWGLAQFPDGTWLVRELLQQGIQLSSFGQDESGEVYALDMGGGTLYQITAK